MYPDRSGLTVLLLLLAAPLAAVPAHAASTRAQLLSKMTAWTGAPASAVVSVTADSVVAVTRRGTVGAGGDIDGVEIIGEIVDDGLAQARGWRSMRATLDVSCTNRSTRIARMEVFPEHGLQGAARQSSAPKGWAQPSVGAYLADVVTAVCFGGPAEQTRRMIVARAAAAPPASPTPPRLRPAVPPPAAEPAHPQAPPASGVVVQIASSPLPKEAEAALAALSARSSITAPLSTRVETATVHGRLYYRAEIAGFASLAEARRFCAKVRAGGDACFVR